MQRYRSESEAEADGIRIVHEPERHRFALIHDVEGQRPDVIGEAHYSLLGDQAIDFDHTVVLPAYRGSGLSGLLAEHVLTNQIVTGRRILASCWFIAKHLEANPHLADASTRPE